MYSDDNIKNRFKRDLYLFVIAIPIISIILIATHYKEIWTFIRDLF